MTPHIARALVLTFALILAPACATGAAQAQTESPAAQQLFLFQYSRGPAWREGVPMREQGLGPHGAYMRQLMNEGRLFAGGGYASDDGGMAIVTAASIEEARAILAGDPAIVSGIFVAELRHWTPRFRTGDPLPGGS
ncbi:MAG: YciI family protein [Caulobacteraceae bacterium]